MWQEYDAVPKGVPRRAVELDYLTRINQKRFGYLEKISYSIRKRGCKINL